MATLRCTLTRTLLFAGLVGLIAGRAQANELDFLLEGQPAQDVPAPDAMNDEPPSESPSADDSDQVVEIVPVESLRDESNPAAADMPTRSRFVEEIVVTAQKREQSLQEVGIAVSAFTGDTLTELGIQDTAALSDLIPGFVFSDSGYSVPIYTIRGVGFNDISQAGSSTVGVYVDEIILPYPAMTKGANLDIARVEVLKGPQGTLYGRNTTGGAVNYIANRPGDEFEMGLSGGYSRFNTVDIEGFVGGPVTDELGVRFAARGIKSDGWQYDYTRSDVEFGADERASARVLMDWLPTDTFSLNLSLDGWLDRSDGQSPQPYVFLDQSAIVSFTPSQAFQNHPLVPDDDARATAIDEGKDFYIDEHFFNASARAKWDFSDRHQLTTIASYQHLKGDNSLNLDGMYVEQFEYFVNTDVPSATFEIRVDGDSEGGDVHWVAGYFFSQDEVTERREFNLRDNSTGNGGRLGIFDELILDGHQESMTNAFFGQLEWQATDNFKYTVGLRYTDERKDNFNCTRDRNGDTALVFSVLEIATRLGAGGLVGAGLTNQLADQIVDALLPSGLPDVPPALTDLVDVLTRAGGNIGLLTGGVGVGDCFTLNNETGQAGPTIGELNEDNVSGRAAIDWTPTDDLRMYGSFSVGYKSGSFPLVPSSNSQQAEPVTQERVNAFEIGIKSTWFDGALRLNAAAFHYDYFDKQLFAFYRDQIFGTLQRLDNVPRSRIDGFELEVQFSPTASLFTAFSMSLLDSEVQEYTGINANGLTVDFAGKKLNYTPPVEASLLVNYEIPALLYGLDASVGFDAVYSSDAEAELSNDPRFVREEYLVYGARASLRHPDRTWGVTLWGRNLTDEVYFSSLQRLSDIGVRYAQRPRTFGVTLDYRF